MKKIEYWSIEIWDGGDHYHSRYAVSDEDAAVEWKDKNPHDTVCKKVLVIYDSLDELLDDRRKSVRAQALAKLTDDERDALGIS